MADIKISDLPSYSGDIRDGVLPIVASGVTSKISGANLLPYKVYSALLTQQGGSGTPSVIVLQNTIGIITWGRVTGGVYSATCSTSVFTDIKTISPQDSTVIKGNGIAYSTLTVYRVDANTVYVETDNLSNSPVDGQLTYKFIEIRVYP